MYKYTNRTRLGKIARTAKAPKTSFRNLIVTNVIYFVTNIVIHCFILLKKKHHRVEYNECEEGLF